MRLTFVAFSFFLLATSPAWAVKFQPMAMKLVSDSPDSIQAKLDLQKISDLDEQLKAAVVAGGFEQELAFRVIGSLERVQLSSWLIERTREKEKTADETGRFVTALATLAPSSEGDRILKFLAQHFDLTSAQIPTPTRLSALTVWELRDQAPELRVLEKLISDEDAQVRMKAMELLEGTYKGEQESLIPLLKKALSGSPFPLRMRAANLTAKLSKKNRQHLLKDLEACSKDPRPEVESACKSALSAP